MKNRHTLFTTVLLYVHMNIFAQVNSSEFKVVDIASHGYGSYAKSVIILHEIYDASTQIKINKNYVVGKIVAMRGNAGAYDRNNVAHINTSSAYNNINGSVYSVNTTKSPWVLKMVIYNTKKYMALEVPYEAAHHDRGFRFEGFIKSTAESLICVAYEDSDQPVNTGILTIIGNFEDNHQNFFDGSLILNNTAKYGGDYSISNGNYNNVLAIGGYGAEKGLKIYKQNSGNAPTFIGPQNYIDTYVIEMTDANGIDADGGIVFGETGSDNIFEDIMVIRGNGNVGINEVNPKNELDVNGTVHAKEVKVDLIDWSDFVFQPNYNLRTLEETEQFINENGHLPDIPSAEEVAKEGISVGEMNAKLLQKIEEQTLYIIELNKKLEELNKKVNKLENN